VFGHKDVETTGTVVAITDSASHVDANGKFRYEVVLDVAATDGPPFRTSTHHWFDPLFSPNPGDVLPVSYDPKSRKTKIHTDGDPRYDVGEHEQQRHQQEEAAVQAAKAQPAGSGSNPGNDPYWGAQYDPELAELVELERQQSAGSPATQAPAPAAPPAPAVSPVPAPAPAPPPVPAALPASPAGSTGEPERLHHLRMLRDSTLLTPKEYEVLRRHLEGGS